MVQMKYRLSPVLSIILVLSMLLASLPAPAAAWDSVAPTANSHYLWAGKAVDELRLESPAYNELDREQIARGAQNEAGHPQRRNLTDPNLPTLYQYAVGNNPGNTSPEYYWQTAVYYYRLYVQSGMTNTAYREQAYFFLGTMLHLLEDASAPPHAYNVMHGAAYLPDPRSQDTVEYLSQIVALQVAASIVYPFFGQYPYNYYMHPSSALQPGKNVLDVGSHGDDDYFAAVLRRGTNSWIHVLDTNLQAPAASRVRVDTYNPSGWPVFYLRFSYYAWRNGVKQYVTHESGEMCAAYTCRPPRTHEWTDTFVANTPMTIEYKRPETSNAVDRQVQFKVYVIDAGDIRNEMEDPHFTNPWEYIEWMDNWVVEHGTSAPFWRRYWRLDGEYGDLKTDLLWETAPNSERALLTMLASASKQTVKWALRAAFSQFKAIEKDVTSVTDADAIGRYSYRVGLYANQKYNSDTHSGLGGGTPDYIRSYSTSCTPYPGKPCAERTITIDGSLVWLSGTVRSVTVRNATVRLYKEDNTFVDLTADTADLGSFDKAVTSIRITPKYPSLPMNSLIGSELLLNGGGDSAAGSTDGGIVQDIPAWETGEMNRATVVQYGAPGFPDASVAGGSLPNVFAGGPNRYQSALHQDVSVASLANVIDTGQLGYSISGYFGGKAELNDWASLSAQFTPSTLPDSRSLAAGKVTAAERDNATGLVFRSVSGFVPIGTRNLDMLLEFTRACQTCTLYNNGYADSLSVVLQVRPNTPPTMTPLNNIDVRPTANVQLDVHAIDAEDGRASVAVYSSNQAVVQDAWIVLSRDNADPTHWVVSVDSSRSGASSMGKGRTVLTVSAFDSSGLRSDQYVVIDVLERVFLPIAVN